MAEKLVADGREVVQLSMEEYTELVELVAEKKKEKDDFYSKRIEMAEEYLKSGKPGFTMDEIRKECREYVAEIRKKQEVPGKIHA